MKGGPLLVAAAAGALMSGALPPSGLWPLLLALVPLFALVAGSLPRESFWLGFTFALTFFTLYVLWLPSSFASPTFFGAYFWLLYPPLLLILASFWGLVTLAARLLGGGGAPTLAILPPLWILMEWARTQGYFAFPWGTLGYAWLDTPVAQLADTVGVWGLSLLSAAIAALLAAPFVSPRPAFGHGATSHGTAFGNAGASGGGGGFGGGFGRSGVPGWRRALPLIAALALLGSAWLAGSYKLTRQLPAPDKSALLVQGNLDPFGRLMGAEGEVRIQAGLTEDGVEALPAPPDLVIWPEGAVMSGFAGQRGREVLSRIQDSAPESLFLVGARVNDEQGSYNSAHTIADGRSFDRYDKHYLVPFGERFPLADAAAPLYRAVFGLFGLAPLTSTSQGAELAPLDSPMGSIAAYICYESVFPQVQRSMVGAGARLLVNITNDAWFSHGDGAAQHYAMGRMRAIETRRYLLRAGNDGVTGVVDPLGRTLAQIPRGISGVMSAPFALSDEVTPWVRYGGWLLPLLTLWIAVAMVGRLFAR